MDYISSSVHSFVSNATKMVLNGHRHDDDDDNTNVGSSSTTTTAATDSFAFSSNEGDVFENPADGELAVLVDGLDDDEHEEIWEDVAQAAKAAFESTGDVPEAVSFEIEQETVSSQPELQPQLDISSARRPTRLSISLTSQSGAFYYGMPLSVEEAIRRMPASPDGLVWNATILPDDLAQLGCNSKDFDPETKQLKPRRPSLPIQASDFFTSLTRVVDDTTGVYRWIFYGVLNGWPALRCFEVMALEQQQKKSSGLFSIPSPRDILTGRVPWEKIWRADKDGSSGVGPSLPDQTRVYRARLKSAPWSAHGWAPDSPGFAFWFEAKQSPPRLSYGTNMIQTVSDDQCTFVHMVSHRYAKLKETAKDKIFYHSVVLLEWQHGQYCTVVESAYLNGMGGFQGKSNWYDDRDSGLTALYAAFPPEMVLPWKTNLAELRAYDVPAKNVDEFRTFLRRHEGGDGRFIDPQISFSHPTRLTFRSKSQIAQYLINYVSRDTSYQELKRNCQTFAADLCCLLAGKKNVLPFHPVSRVEYTNRTYTFLYDSHMYQGKSKNKKT